MKARIKETGEIFPIAPYARVTLDVCDSRGNPLEVEFDNIELISDSEPNVDWSSFRREAAKDILARSYNPIFLVEPQVKNAIKAADELIKYLQEEQK